MEATWRCYSSVLAPEQNRNVIDCLKTKNDCKNEIEANDKAVLKFWEKADVPEAMEALEAIKAMEEACWPQIQGIEKCQEANDENACKEPLSALIKCFSNIVAKKEARIFEDCIKTSATQAQRDCTKEAEALSVAIYSHGVGKFMSALGYTTKDIEDGDVSSNIGLVWSGAEAKLRKHFNI